MLIIAIDILRFQKPGLIELPLRPVSRVRAAAGTTFPDCRTVLRRTLVLSGLDGSSGIVKPRDHNYPPLLSATEKIFHLKRASALSA